MDNVESEATNNAGIDDVENETPNDDVEKKVKHKATYSTSKKYVLF